MEKPKYDIKNGIVNFKKINLPSKSNLKNNHTSNGKHIYDFKVMTFWGEVNGKFMRIVKVFPDFIKTFSLLRSYVKGAKKKGFAYHLPLKFYEEPKTWSTEWGLAFQFFQRMDQLARENKSKFVVFFIPEAAQILNEYENESILIP